MNLGVNTFMLEACVLAVIATNDTYGYALTQQIKKNLEVSESTLYPVLRRLQKDGYLTTYDIPYDGRNRRYYKITLKGKEKYKEYNRVWKDYRFNIDQLFMEADKL